MRIAQCALLGVSSLSSLLETSAVRHATEDAGDELRIISKAESVEELILLVDVPIQARIKRILVFEQLWRSSKVGRDRRACRRRIEIQKCNCVGIKTAPRN